jgi:hypothetical protein
MFEHRSAPLLPRSAYLARLAKSAALSGALVCVSLGIGVWGYMQFAGLGFVDALLNASMILTGMGPVNPMESNGAKLFASAYALFSGVAFLTIIGLLVSPIVHRFLHRFHLEAEGADTDDAPPGTDGAPKV